MSERPMNFNHMFRYMNEITRISFVGFNFNLDHPNPEYSLQIEIEFNGSRNDQIDRWIFDYYGESHPASRELIDLLTLFLETQAKEILEYLQKVHQKFQMMQEILAEAKRSLAIIPRSERKEVQTMKMPTERDPYLDELEEIVTILILMAQTHGKTAEFDPDTLKNALRALLKSCQWQVPILAE